MRFVFIVLSLLAAAPAAGGMRIMESRDVLGYGWKTCGDWAALRENGFRDDIKNHQVSQWISGYVMGRRLAHEKHFHDIRSELSFSDLIKQVDQICRGDSKMRFGEAVHQALMPLDLSGLEPLGDVKTKPQRR